MSDLTSHIETSIGAKRLFRDGQRILAAVSGGLDSMVLLDLLHRLSKTHRWKLTVAHFNHQLRGAASDADEQLVAQDGPEAQAAFRGGARGRAGVRPQKRVVGRNGGAEVAARFFGRDRRKIEDPHRGPGPSRR